MELTCGPPGFSSPRWGPCWPDKPCYQARHPEPGYLPSSPRIFRFPHQKRMANLSDQLLQFKTRFNDHICQYHLKTLYMRAFCVMCYSKGYYKGPVLDVRLNCTHTIKAAIPVRGTFKCQNIKDINKFLSQTFYIGQCSTINKYYVFYLIECRFEWLRYITLPCICIQKFWKAI